MKRAQGYQGRSYESRHKRRTVHAEPPRDRSPDRRPAIRHGYDAVARTPGAAVIGEMKYFDTELQHTSLVACTTTWPAGTMLDPSSTINLGSAAVATPLSLCVPTVGSALNQRVGRQIKVRKIKFRGYLNCAPQAAQSTADASSVCRVVLVMDQQTNAAQMNGAQLFNDAGAADTTINSFQNPNNFGRFRVLKDKIIKFGNPNLAGSPTAMDMVQAGEIRTIKFSVNFRNPVTVHFNATNGGTVADIVDNSFHIVAACSSILLVPQLSYYCRVCYTE